MRNPFIPSRSPVCELANLILIFGVTFAGLTAAAVALLASVMP
ncbi:UNVERIFIED_ORG: hypothetical protein GGD48_000810 [Rhizobium etli]|nr:hypothetical protein [Rhizobium sp. Kim5]